jgi:hypothetical protein
MKIGSKFRPNWILRQHLVQCYRFEDSVVGTVVQVEDDSITVQFVNDEYTLNIKIDNEDLNESGAII